jgi:hypothetical protein
LLLNAREKES